MRVDPPCMTPRTLDMPEYGITMNAEHPESQENMDNMDHSGIPRPILSNPNAADSPAASGGAQAKLMNGFQEAVYSTTTSIGPHSTRAPTSVNMERRQEKSASEVVSFGPVGRQGEFRYDPPTPFPDVYPRPTYPEFPQGPYSDWHYEQRRTMQEIVPNVFLGPLAAASRNSLGNMLAAGLTHVVCVRAPIERTIIRTNHPDHFKYMVVEMEDKVTENIIRHFEPVNAFINAAVESGGRVLIHGSGGCCRSAVLVIAYIMNRYGVSLPEAYSHAQHKRFCICPPAAFLNQLREYEPIYRARHVVPLPIPDPDNPQRDVPRKRSLSDSEDNDDSEAPQFQKRNAAAFEGMEQD